MATSTRSEIVIANWPIRGLGAPIIYVCEYLKVPYRELLYKEGAAPDYSRISFRSVKDTLGIPFANLPYVIDGEVKIAQSLACTRHICRKWGADLLGRDLRDLALVDTLSQILHEDRLKVQGELGYSSIEPGPIIEEGLRRLEPIADHMSGRPFLAGDYVTYVDFILWENIDYLNVVGKGEALSSCDLIKHYVNRMNRLPGFKEFLASDRFRRFPFSTASSPHGAG